MTWGEDMKMSASGLASVGASVLPDWSPKDKDSRWADMLRYGYSVGANAVRSAF